MRSVLELNVGRKEVRFVYGDKDFILRKSRGMIYMIELLCHAWHQIDAGALARLTKYDGHCIIEISDANLSLTEDPEHGIPYCDKRTIHEIKMRLVALTEEYAEACVWNDLARAEDIRTEMDQLERYLSETFSPKRQIRMMPSAARRVQAAVNKALVRVIGQIAETDGDLAAHLRSSLHLGSRLVYTPGDLDILIRYCD